MKTACLSLVLVSLTPALALGCACSAGSADAGSHHGAALAAKGDAPARHPLKGVVVEVMADHSALLVKHEEIPGVMKAMTMMLKVDEAGLKAVTKGSAVTGMLVRKADGWWLEDVQATSAGTDSKPAGA